jgi:hypothetical protein
MTERDQLDWLKQRVTGAGGVPALLRVLEDLQGLEPKQERAEDVDELRLEALDALIRLTQETPVEAAPIILRHLLPLCLRAREEWRAPRVAHRYDEALSAWLDRYPALHRYTLRAAVLEALAESLAGPAVVRASRLIGRLGYRDEQVAARLLELARRGPEAVRDVAIHVLAVLGVPPSRQAALVELWLERASAVPWNNDLIGAAKRLASPEILGPVFERWLTPENLRDSDAARSFLPGLAIAVPAAVAEAFPDDAGLQDRVWDRLRALEPSAPDLFFMRVLGSTQVAHPCDSPGVVRYYLSRLADDERNRDLAYIRLEECDRPRQLLGWEEDPGQRVVQSVQQDASAATAMVGSFMTQDLRRKLRAWETLLSLGRGKALAHFGEAVAGERNGHAVGAVLDLAACFRLDPVPPRVRDLLACEFGEIEDDSQRLSGHVSAIAVARASGSASGLEALLAFSLIGEGGVLISLPEGLADTTAALIKAGHAAAPERLWQAAAPGQPEHRRAAAAGALGRLLRRNLLHPLPVDRLVALVEDETLDRAARRDVIEGLGHLPATEVPPQIAQALRGALAAPPAVPGGNGEEWWGDFRPVALAALARLGLLTEDPDAIRQHLGLRQEGTTWRCDSTPLLPGAPVVIGILYARDPGAYTPAAADLLREGDWAAVIQLAPFLRSGPLPAPEVIVGAVLERVRRAGPELGEPELVPLLADLAPGRIASESWSGMSSWPPQVRAALADALAHAPSPGDPDGRVNLLLVLMGDGQYGVRRAAFRAMARVSPERLRSVCAAWALLTEANVQPAERPYVIDMRRRAAEAAAWLESLPAEGPIADLAHDPEPEVRATFSHCQRERRERDWARAYLRIVLTACDDASLLEAWKYGRALERVGDDEALERLEDRRRQDLPSGLRHWLGRLSEKLRTRWDEVTRGWPEPWFARRGRLERVDALVGEEAMAKRVSCWLWQVPPTDLVDLGVWGGWCADEALPTGMHTLRVPGRRPGTVLVTRTTWGRPGPTYFVGSGDYPEAVAEADVRP